MSDRWRDHQQSCKHFTGFLEPSCQAGIAYSTFAPGSYPCLPQYNIDGGRCDCFEVMTDEEAQAKEAAIQKAAVAGLEALLEGSCQVCGAKVEKEVQRGRSVYAEPCGHRLYQGKVGALRRAGQVK